MDDPFAFAQMQAFNSYLCSHLHVAHAHRMRGYRWVDADDTHSIAAMQRKVPQSVGECFDLVEREMLKGPWVMGERYTICDPYLFTLAQWLEADGVDPKRIPARDRSPPPHVGARGRAQGDRRGARLGLVGPADRRTRSCGSIR